MDLDETWQVGLRPDKTKPCTFPAKSRYGFRRQREKMDRRDVVFASLLPLSLDRFPPNFPRTRVQVVARDTWFHIPENFPLMDLISRKTLFKVPYLWSGYGSRETFCDAYTQGVGLTIKRSWDLIPGRAALKLPRSTQPSILPGNRVPAWLAGVKAGRVHLCRVAGNTIGVGA